MLRLAWQQRQERTSTEIGRTLTPSTIWPGGRKYPLHCNSTRIHTQIKADRPLTRDTLNAPWLLTNRQFQWTGNGHSQLPLASRVLISTGSAPLVQTGERKQFSLFDLDLWPTLTYNHKLAKVKGDPHAKNQGQRSNGSNSRALTDKRTHTHTRTHTRKLPNVLSPLLRGR